MECYENFKVRCDNEEAIRIQDQVTISVMQQVHKCYCEAYKGHMKTSNEILWLQHCALTSVYMLGFLSGSRAIRERLKAKNGTKCN